MTSRTRRSTIIVLVSLCGLAGVLVSFAYFLLLPPLVATGVVRDDLVTGPGNKQYRRLVRVKRGNGAITTSVTFTQIATGGVGQATFIQPDLPTVPRWQRLVKWARVSLGLRLRLTKADLWEMDRMVIPYPMRPGQKWIVRQQLGFSGWGHLGRGKGPRGAAIDTQPSPLNLWHIPLIDKDASIVYGERICFPYR